MKAILFSAALLGILAMTPTLSMAGDIDGSSLYAVHGVATSLTVMSDDELAKVEGGQSQNAGGVAIVQGAVGLVAANVAVPVNANVNDVLDVNNNRVSVQANVLGGAIQITRQP